MENSWWGFIWIEKEKLQCVLSVLLRLKNPLFYYKILLLQTSYFISFKKFYENVKGWILSNLYALKNEKQIHKTELISSSIDNVTVRFLRERSYHYSLGAIMWKYCTKLWGKCFNKFISLKEMSSFL